MNHANATIKRGDKIALIGANGKGKSTLLRILYGSEPLNEGKVEKGHNVITSFYAQHQLESLNVKNEILQEIREAGSGKLENELRSILGCFLFSGDEVFKTIKVLSGGEKARVALAKTLLNEANFMLLDEPTNHLDMQSIGILISALQNFEGSYVIVSHDRYFVSETANKIWWFEDGKIKEYPGTFEEYRYWYDNVYKSEATPPPDVGKNTEPVKKDEGLQEQDFKKKQLKKLKNELDSYEKTLSQLEKDKSELEKELSDVNQASDNTQLGTIYERYGEVLQEINAVTGKFERLFENVLELENELKN
jgi:ATP-binding cassette subfamily F protein 3